MIWTVSVPAMWRLHARVLALGALVGATVLLGLPADGTDAPQPDATIAVSSTTAASALGLTLVEGVLRQHDRAYLLTLHGVEPSAASTGKVYGLARAREIEGRYTASDNGLRNERGVTMVFDPPLQVTGGEVRVELNTRVYPKASTGQRGTVD